MDGGRDREAKQRVEPASMERSSCDAVASKDSTQRRLERGRAQSLIDGRRGAPPSEDKEVHDRESKLRREESAAIRLKRLEREPNALHIAVASGELDDVMFLLERGRSVQDRGDFGRPVLLEAATYGHVNVVHELTTNYGASIEDKNEFEQTALSLAAKYGHVQVVRNLIARGAVVDAKDRSGRTPLSYAAASGHAGVVQELLKDGAVVDAKRQE